MEVVEKVRPIYAALDFEYVLLAFPIDRVKVQVKLRYNIRKSRTEPGIRLSL